MTSLVSRGPAVDMTTPSLGNRLNSYVTRGKTRILYGFLLARPYFFKTLRVFFHKVKNTALAIRGPVTGMATHAHPQIKSLIM